MSLKSGFVPEDWRNAHVTILFKKDSKSDVKSFRPISLTSIQCKILETITTKSIDEHLDKYKLLYSGLHGFYSGKSCQSNLLGFYNTAQIGYIVKTLSI